MKKHFFLQLILIISTIIICFIFLDALFAEEKIDTTLVRGMIDRKEDNNLAVILIPDLDRQLIIPENELPKGSREGMWVILQQSTNGYTVLSHDDEKTRRIFRENLRLRNRLRE